MPSVKYTRIEITQEAYLALEAEAILQGKTLKKLASEMILKGASKKALNFVQESNVSIEANLNYSRDKLSRVINDIGTTKISIDESVMEIVQKSLVDEGYQGAMLYVAQHTASMQRDELFRILTTCQLNKVPSAMAVDIIKSLKRMQDGKLTPSSEF
jgi:intergrase/recombinase